MGVDFNIKPVGAPVATPVIRPAPEAVREAVPTQLPPDKTVTAAARVLQPNISAANSQQVDSDRISKEVIINKGAGVVVFVSVDKNSNQVIDQFPEESRLRSLAYLRAMDTLRQDAKVQDRRIETDRSV
jgi:hypothetical protein